MLRALRALELLSQQLRLLLRRHHAPLHARDVPRGGLHLVRHQALQGRHVARGRGELTRCGAARATGRQAARVPQEVRRGVRHGEGRLVRGGEDAVGGGVVAGRHEEVRRGERGAAEVRARRAHARAAVRNDVVGIAERSADAIHVEGHTEVGGGGPSRAAVLQAQQLRLACVLLALPVGVQILLHGVEAPKEGLQHVW